MAVAKTQVRQHIAKATDKETKGGILILFATDGACLLVRPGLEHRMRKNFATRKRKEGRKEGMLANQLKSATHRKVEVFMKIADTQHHQK